MDARLDVDGGVKFVAKTDKAEVRLVMPCNKGARPLVGARPRSSMLIEILV